MDNLTHKQITDFAWDCVIGSGEGPEWAELGIEPKPSADALCALSRRLGHPLTAEEHGVFAAAWKVCIMECANP